MSEVKRYDMRVSLGGVESYESPCGDYVDYEDYAEIEAKCAELAVENGKLKEFISLECMVFGDSNNLLVAEPFIPQAQETDAFLAEIERKVIRKFINSIEHILRDRLSPYDTEEMLEAMRVFVEEQGAKQ